MWQGVRMLSSKLFNTNWITLTTITTLSIICFPVICLTTGLLLSLSQASHISSRALLWPTCSVSYGFWRLMRGYSPQCIHPQTPSRRICPGTAEMMAASLARIGPAAGITLPYTGHWRRYNLDRRRSGRDFCDFPRAVISPHFAPHPL
ncbi:hypothetical protein BaRGS_00039066 [Batillaria attramentaria]|uniref:Uncharacterized protein n=1 Tax=Batillaria attramentaria TaxID=370345 RepID=A0ABD0J4Q5_9CAEN